MSLFESYSEWLRSPVAVMTKARPEVAARLVRVARRPGESREAFLLRVLSAVYEECTGRLAPQAPEPVLGFLQPLQCPKSMPMPRLTPAQQMAWGAKYIRERYGQTKRSWESYVKRIEEEKTMGNSQTKLFAPENPYRRGAMRGQGEVYFEGMPAPVGPVPRRYDGASGPGLQASDLDRMVRQHFVDGYAAAEREYEAKAEELRAQLGDAFDEGYTAGRVERAHGLAAEFVSRLLGLHFVLRQVEEGSKSKAHEGLASVRASLDELAQFADRMNSDGAAVAAVEAT